MDQTDHHGDFVVKQLQRPFDQSQLEERPVQHAGLGEDRDPGEVLDQDAAPPWHDQQDEQRDPPSRRDQGEVVGDGVSKEQGRDRHDDRDAERPQGRPEIEAGFPDPLVVLDREAQDDAPSGRARGQAVDEDDEHGDEKKRGQPGDRRRERAPAGPACSEPDHDTGSPGGGLSGR